MQGGSATVAPIPLKPLPRLGGRTAVSFESDVWRWTFSGSFCSLEWRGQWRQLTPAAAWAPRHGHSIVGFAPDGGTSARTVLLLGGFGGQPEYTTVVANRTADLVLSRNDVWCGNEAMDGFATWTQLAPAGPFSARAQAAAVVAPTISSYTLLYFGGYDEYSRLNRDLWRWSGEDATYTCSVEEI